MEDGFSEPSVSFDLLDGAYASIVMNQEVLVVAGWRFLSLYLIDSTALDSPVELMETFSLPSRGNKLLAITDEKIICG